MRELVERNRAAGRERPRGGVARHRRLRREPVLRRRGRLRQGQSRGHPRANPGHQPRAGGGHAGPSPHALVSQHVVVEATPRRVRVLTAVRRAGQPLAIRSEHPQEGVFFLHVEGTPELLFCENDTNVEKLWGAPNAVPVRQGRLRQLYRPRAPRRGEPRGDGNKGRGALASDGWSRGDAYAAASTEPGGPGTGRRRGCGLRPGLRRGSARPTNSTPPSSPPSLSPDGKNVMRQALGGLLWSKQFYHYVVRDWLHGDPAQPAPPESRKTVATPTGDTSSTPTCSPCQTSGSIRGLPRGTSPSTASRWRWSIRTLPRTSSSAPAGVVHAPERTDSCVRMGLRRCEPSGLRVGCAARLPN